MSAARSRAIDFGTAPSSDDWGPAEPFDALALPPFPVETLPHWLGAWVTAVSTSHQVPADLPATVALGVLSFAASRLVRVQVGPDWSEPTNLYAVVALPPGERKSAVFAKATGVLDVRQSELLAELGPRSLKRRDEREVLEAQIAKLKADAARGKAEGVAQRVEGLRGQLAQLPELHIPHLVTDDVTPEALAIVLAQSGERVGHFSAEGGPFEMMAGRYSDKGGNFELFLKGHSGDRHTVHRVKRDSVSLKHPLISIAMTVQPTVIEGLAGKDGFRGRGLLARFLYSLPTSRLGERDIEPAPMPEHAQRAYDERLLRALRCPPSDAPLVLSPEAHAARVAFQARLEPRLGPDGDLSPIADWANKLTGAVCRIAGILRAFDDDDAPHISTRHVIQAQTIGEYFLEHARAAFQAMGGDEVTEQAKRIWAWCQRREVRSFTVRDARKAIHATGDISNALAVLIARNLIRESTAEPTGGRPTTAYLVRPG